MPPDNPEELTLQHILAEIKNSNKNYEEIRKEQVAMRMDFLKGMSDVREDFLRQTQVFSIELAVLKVKSGVWGLVGGAIPVALGLLIWFIQSKP